MGSVDLSTTRDVFICVGIVAGVYLLYNIERKTTHSVPYREEPPSTSIEVHEEPDGADDEEVEEAVEEAEADEGN